MASFPTAMQDMMDINDGVIGVTVGRGDHNSYILRLPSGENRTVPAYEVAKVVDFDGPVRMADAMTWNLAGSEDRARLMISQGRVMVNCGAFVTDPETVLTKGLWLISLFNYDKSEAWDWFCARVK
jgi:hypothetical protein